MQHDNRPEVPDDIRAELDREERAIGSTPVRLPTADAVPEDVLGERDQEARKATAVVQAALTEGGLPMEDDLEA
jgi:hypothetical protein